MFSCNAIGEKSSHIPPSDISRPADKNNCFDVKPFVSDQKTSQLSPYKAPSVISTDFTFLDDRRAIVLCGTDNLPFAVKSSWTSPPMGDILGAPSLLVVLSDEGVRSKVLALGGALVET